MVRMDQWEPTDISKNLMAMGENGHVHRHNYSGVMTIRFAPFSSMIQGENQRATLRNVGESVTLRYKRLSCLNTMHQMMHQIEGKLRGLPSLILPPLLLATATSPLS